VEVILVNPPYSKFVYSTRKRGAAVELPLGLAYIAGFIEKEGFKVSILDANAENIDITKTTEKIANSPAQMVGITTTTMIIPIVYELSEKIKQISNKMIVVGGPHVSFMDTRTLEECMAIDIVVRGEGELTMLDLIKNEGRPETVTGVTYRNRDTGQIVTNPDRERIKDINALPFPARHLFPVELYRPGVVLNIGVSGKDYASILTARGCPNKCTFCSSSHFWGTKVRLRSPENIVAEIESLIQDYGVKEIFFKDDTFTFPPARTEKICDLLLERKINVSWCCYARVDSLTEKVVKKMKSAGCFGLDLGIESGNQEVLNRVNKRITLEQSRQAVKYAKNTGMMIYASFILGLPGDSLETINETINFAKELNPHFAHFFVATPFPGTELYKEAIQQGWLSQLESWKDLDASASTKYRNEALSNAEIRQLLIKAYREFYTRPHYLWQSIKRAVTHPKEIRQYALGMLVIISLAEI